MDNECNSKTNKLDSIFNELIEFLYELEILGSRVDFDLNRFELDMFENEFQINLNSTLKLYLLYFGASFRQNILPNELHVYSINNIKYAVNESKIWKLKSAIVKNIENNGQDEYQIIENIDSIIPLFFIDTTCTFGFISNISKNPEVLIYHHESPNEPLEQISRLSNHIRYEILSQIKFYLGKASKLQFNTMKLSRLWWFKAIKTVMDYSQITYNFHSLLREFQKREILDTVGLDEFIFLFLKWTIEEKDMINVLDEFDPYYIKTSNYSVNLKDIK